MTTAIQNVQNDINPSLDLIIPSSPPSVTGFQIQLAVVNKTTEEHTKTTEKFKDAQFKVIQANENLKKAQEMVTKAIEYLEYTKKETDRTFNNLVKANAKLQREMMYLDTSRHLVASPAYNFQQLAVSDSPSTTMNEIIIPKLVDSSSLIQDTLDRDEGDDLLDLNDDQIIPVPTPPREKFSAFAPISGSIESVNLDFPPPTIKIEIEQVDSGPSEPRDRDSVRSRSSTSKKAASKFSPYPRRTRRPNYNKNHINCIAIEGPNGKLWSAEKRCQLNDEFIYYVNLRKGEGKTISQITKELFPDGGPGAVQSKQVGKWVRGESCPFTKGAITAMQKWITKEKQQVDAAGK